MLKRWPRIQLWSSQAASIVLLLALVACQPDTPTSMAVPRNATLVAPAVSPTPLPFRTIQLSGEFVFAAGDGSIWLEDAETLQARVLLAPGQKEYYDAPAFSPDGRRVLFVAHLLDLSGIPTNEIREIGVDGTNARTLFTPPAEGPKVYPAFPRFSPDGSAIWFSMVVSGTTVKGQKYQVARGPATGGAWTIVLIDGQQPVLSPSGDRMAFLRLNAETFSSGLWTARPDGSEPQALVPDDVFVALTGERFAPNGREIVFAASGPPRRKLSSGSSECAFQALSLCLVARAHADGLPWDLWRIGVDGKGLEQLTQLGLDSPWPAFSRDGRYIVFNSTAGLDVYDQQTGQVSQLTRQGAHGVLDWYQR